MAFINNPKGVNQYDRKGIARKLKKTGKRISGATEDFGEGVERRVTGARKAAEHYGRRATGRAGILYTKPGYMKLGKKVSKSIKKNVAGAKKAVMKVHEEGITGLAVNAVNLARDATGTNNPLRRAQSNVLKYKARVFSRAKAGVVSDELKRGVKATGQRKKAFDVARKEIAKPGGPGFGTRLALEAANAEIGTRVAIGRAGQGMDTFGAAAAKQYTESQKRAKKLYKKYA